MFPFARYRYVCSTKVLYRHLVRNAPHRSDAILTEHLLMYLFPKFYRFCIRLKTILHFGQDVTMSLQNHYLADFLTAVQENFLLSLEVQLYNRYMFSFLHRKKEIFP